MEPVLTMVIGLDGSGREDVQAEGTRVRTAEEAVRLVKGGDSAVLDAPNLRARTRRGILEQLRGVPAVKRAVVTLRPVEQCRACCPEREKEVWEQYLSFQPPETYEGWDEIELRYDESCEKIEQNGAVFRKGRAGVSAAGQSVSQTLDRDALPAGGAMGRKEAAGRRCASVGRAAARYRQAADQGVF